MGLKNKSITKFKERLAEVLNVINKAKGAKQKLRQIINRVSKKDIDKIKKKANDSRQADGMEILCEPVPVERKQNSDHSSEA